MAIEKSAIITKHVGILSLSRPHLHLLYSIVQEITSLVYLILPIAQSPIFQLR
jgi:hypothetical protein